MAKKSPGKKSPVKKSVSPAPRKKSKLPKAAPRKGAVGGRAASPGKLAASPTGALTGTGPLSLPEALKLVQGAAPVRTARRRAAAVEVKATQASVAQERQALDDQVDREHQRRIEEYQAVMKLLESRGIKELTEPVAAASGRRGGGPPAAPAIAAAAALPPLRIFAEGDSWFDYKAFILRGGLIPRLQKRLGVPILNLARAGDEVRNMLGVKERQVLTTQLANGYQPGKPWDVLLFSGGGNDIVGDPMALWVDEFNPAVPAEQLLNEQRFTAALRLVQSAYEDLIQLRNRHSPSTLLILHSYDFAIPDGRGVCGYGPWLKPAFDLRGFPGMQPRVAVVNAMLKKFAAMLQGIADQHAGVTFINTQATLSPVVASWHNELHPAEDGFDKIAALFQQRLRALFPGRVL